MTEIIGILRNKHNLDQRIKNRLYTQHHFRSISLDAPIQQALVAAYGGQIQRYNTPDLKSSALAFMPSRTYLELFQGLRTHMIDMAGAGVFRDLAETLVAGDVHTPTVISDIVTTDDLRWLDKLGGILIVISNRPDAQLGTDVDMPATLKQYHITSNATPTEFGEAVDYILDRVAQESRLVVRKERGVVPNAAYAAPS